eukprot:6691027-Karenia_brevis.AAC.1
MLPRGYSRDRGNYKPKRQEVPSKVSQSVVDRASSSHQSAPEVRPKAESSQQSSSRGHDKRKRTRERSKRSKLERSRQNVEAAQRLSRGDVEVRAPWEDEHRVKREDAERTESWREKRERMGMEGVDFNNSEEDEADRRPRERAHSESSSSSTSSRK